MRLQTTLSNKCPFLLGCSELQINAACQFLNGKLDWQIKTFPGHMETYEKLVPICRDILHPEFRYFTRHNRTKPYMWNPLVPSPDGAIPTLGVGCSTTVFALCLELNVELYLGADSQRFPRHRGRHGKSNEAWSVAGRASCSPNRLGHNASRGRCGGLGCSGSG